MVALSPLSVTLPPALGASLMFSVNTFGVCIVYCSFLLTLSHRVSREGKGRVSQEGKLRPVVPPQPPDFLCKDSVRECQCSGPGPSPCWVTQASSSRSVLFQPGISCHTPWALLTRVCGKEIHTAEAEPSSSTHTATRSDSGSRSQGCACCPGRAFCVSCHRQGRLPRWLQPLP